MPEPISKADRRRYRYYMETEIESASMYQVIADAEDDPDRAEIFRRLVDSEIRHASRWAEKLGIDPSSMCPKASGLKLNFLKLASNLFGTRRLIPWLARIEAREIALYDKEPEAQDLVSEERQHAVTLRKMSKPINRFPELHPEKSINYAASGSLRAAVLGVNDGLVSNFSLVMGVAAGTATLGHQELILVAGVAGLLAGAFSMAAGEYVSMRSQRDIYEHQIEIERIELMEFPEEEQEELELIYRAKGLAAAEARTVAEQIMSRPDVALETMTREKLGLDPSQLGSPLRAAASSFAAFTLGAAVPISPYILGAEAHAFILSASLSALALLVVGGSIAATTSRNIAWGSIRMMIVGGSAAAVTFTVGHLIGAAVTN